MNPELATSTTTQLQPSYAIPTFLIILAGASYWVYAWLCPFVGLLGLSLAYQAATLRLVFTANALDIYRGASQIRHFPYQEWQNWRIFWAPVPTLLYFRETKSIHFLPILFDPKALETNLKQYCPQKS